MAERLAEPEAASRRRVSLTSMPGIFGLITRKPANAAQAELEGMMAAARHAPNHMAGTHVEESLGLYVGWTARRGSFAARMPQWNESGDWCLIFAGEHYARPEDVRSLKARGHTFNPEGADYLVHLAEEEGARFPAGLNGRFHGVVIDSRRGVGMLFNDRYGLQRLYYSASADTVYFAAEAKAILAVRPELRAVDWQSLGEFVSCGCVLEDRTLFAGINVLPIASRWMISRGTVTKRESYFSPAEWEKQEGLKGEAYYRELRDVFSRTLPLYFNGPERIGMSVTGGLDTRMILAWHSPEPGAMPCYSFGSMFRSTQDVLIGRRVAAACRQTHEVIRVGGEFLAQFPEYARRTVYLTDGCADVSHAADLYVNERAAQIAPVRMTGNYGGEVLRRVRAFKPTALAPDLFVPELNAQISAAERTYGRLLKEHPLTFMAFRQAPWHHYGLLSLEQTQVSLRSPFLDNEFVRTVYRALDSACANNDISLRLIADGDKRLAQIPTDRGLVFGRNDLLSGMIRQAIQFTVKAEYAYDYGMPQWVARIDHSVAPLHLEKLFLGRHKFYHYRVWYRDALAPYVREMLLDSKTLGRPYLRREAVEAIALRHLRGDRNYTSEIHKILTLELVHRSLLEELVI